jgi:hypothetical protein
VKINIAVLRDYLKEQNAIKMAEAGTPQECSDARRKYLYDLVAIVMVEKLAQGFPGVIEEA